MRVLLIFVDGVGLGEPHPTHNPFCAADLPTLTALAGGQIWTRNARPHHDERALFIPTDANLGVAGRPQSGTGQATIVTGRNVPRIIGGHYGPKPDAATREVIREGNLFMDTVNGGKSAALLEAYPPAWHHVIRRGKRLPSSYQLAAQSAGLRFFDEDDLRAGRALSGDWTGAGWHSELGYEDTPIITPYEAGQKLVALAREYDFAFFSHWLTDVVGHRGTLQQAVDLLVKLDAVMRGVLDAWDDEEGVVVLTSDHGNIEAINHKNHTRNDVPTVVIGAAKSRFEAVRDLSDIAPVIRDLLRGDQ